MRNLTIADALRGEPGQNNRAKSATERTPQENQPFETAPELEPTQKRRSSPLFNQNPTSGRQPGIAGSSSKNIGSAVAGHGGSRAPVSDSPATDAAVTTVALTLTECVRVRSRSPDTAQRSRSASPGTAQRNRSSSPDPAQQNSSKSAPSQSDSAHPRVDASAWSFVPAESAHRWHAPGLSGKRPRKTDSDDRRANVPSSSNGIEARGTRFQVGGLVVDVHAAPKAQEATAREDRSSRSTSPEARAKSSARTLITGSANENPLPPKDEEEIFYFIGVSEADEAAS